MGINKKGGSIKRNGSEVLLRNTIDSSMDMIQVFEAEIIASQRDTREWRSRQLRPGIMNIAQYVGNTYRSIRRVNMKVIRTGTIGYGYASSVTTNISVESVKNKCWSIRAEDFIHTKTCLKSCTK